MTGAAVTAVDFDAAAAVTLDYLKTYMTSQFAFNTDALLSDFVGSLTGTDLGRVEASYDAALLFADSSTAVPASTDVDALLFAAFQQPFVQDLLDALGQLPASNPFSTTSAVTYNPNRRRFT